MLFEDAVAKVERQFYNIMDTAFSRQLWVPAEHDISMDNSEDKTEKSFDRLYYHRSLCC